MRPDDIDDAMTMGEHSVLELQVLAQIRDSLAVLMRDARTTSDTIADVRERVVRLEEREGRLAAVEQTVAKLGGKIDILTQDKDRRDGASSLAAWLFKNWPGVLGLLALAVVVLKANGKI